MKLLYKLDVIVKNDSTKTLDEVLETALIWANERTLAALNQRYYYVDVFDTRTKKYYKVFSDEAAIDRGISGDLQKMEIFSGDIDATVYNSSFNLTEEQNTKLMSLKNTKQAVFDNSFVEDFEDRFDDINKEIKKVKTTTDKVETNMLLKNDKRLNNLNNIDKKISDIKTLKLNQVEELLIEFKVEPTDIEKIIINNKEEVDLSIIEYELKELNKKEIDLSGINKQLTLIEIDTKTRLENIKSDISKKVEPSDLLPETDLKPIENELSKITKDLELINNNLQNNTDINENRFDEILNFLNDNNISIEEIWNYNNRKLTSSFSEEKLTDEELFKTLPKRIK